MRAEGERCAPGQVAAATDIHTAGQEAARCGQRCFYADGRYAIRRKKVRANTPAALYEVRIRRLPDAMARPEWQVPRQRMRRYCGRRAGRYAHRVPIAARAPGL